MYDQICEECVNYQPISSGYGKCKAHDMEVWPVATCNSFQVPNMFKVVATMKDTGKNVFFGQFFFRGQATEQVKNLQAQAFRFSHIAIEEV